MVGLPFDYQNTIKSQISHKDHSVNKTGKGGYTVFASNEIMPTFGAEFGW